MTEDRFKTSDMELDPPDEKDQDPEKATGEPGISMSDMSLSGITGEELNAKISQKLGNLILTGEGYDKLQSVKEGSWAWDKKPISEMSGDEIEIVLQKLEESGLKLYQ